MEKNWLEAIKRVLEESPGTPMHYTDITEQILSRGLFHTNSATPAGSVNNALNLSINNDSGESPFVRREQGMYMLKQTAQAGQSVKPIASEFVEEQEEEKSRLIIHSFGMYWQRDLVIWSNNPRLFGKQPFATKQVDFGKQIGIYILYDHHTVVYVGRTSDGTLGKRLYDHNKDRLATRWNSFSWFGLLSVTEEGKLNKTVFNFTLPSLAGTLEALLIEALEPPQNRRRGDGFKKDIEYIQDIDPKLKERELLNTLRSIEDKLLGGT